MQDKNEGAVKTNQELRNETLLEIAQQPTHYPNIPFWPLANLIETLSRDQAERYFEVMAGLFKVVVRFEALDEF